MGLMLAVDDVDRFDLSHEHHSFNRIVREVDHA